MKKHYDNLRDDVVGFLPGRLVRLLDIGCGTGAFLRSAKSRTGCETWGVEPDAAMAEAAARNADHVVAAPVEQALDRLPDGSFDCVCCNDVLEHLVDPWGLLARVRAKLAPGGVVVASIPNLLAFAALAQLLLHRDWRYVPYGILDSGHLRFFTRKSMRRMFEEGGYEVLVQRGINRDRTWKATAAHVVTLGLFRECLYEQFVVVARPAVPGGGAGSRASGERA